MASSPLLSNPALVERARILRQAAELSETTVAAFRHGELFVFYGADAERVASNLGVTLLTDREGSSYCFFGVQARADVVAALRQANVPLMLFEDGFDPEVPTSEARTLDAREQYSAVQRSLPQGVILLAKQSGLYLVQEPGASRLASIFRGSVAGRTDSPELRFSPEILETVCIELLSRRIEVAVCDDLDTRRMRQIALPHAGGYFPKDEEVVARTAPRQTGHDTSYFIEWRLRRITPDGDIWEKLSGKEQRQFAMGRALEERGVYRREGEADQPQPWVISGLGSSAEEAIGNASTPAHLFAAAEQSPSVALVGAFFQHKAATYVSVRKARQDIERRVGDLGADVRADFEVRAGGTGNVESLRRELETAFQSRFGELQPELQATADAVELLRELTLKTWVAACRFVESLTVDRPPTLAETPAAVCGAARADQAPAELVTAVAQIATPAAGPEASTTADQAPADAHAPVPAVAQIESAADSEASTADQAPADAPGPVPAVVAQIEMPAAVPEASAADQAPAASQPEGDQAEKERRVLEYRARKAARIDRLQERADRASKEATSHYNVARRMGDAIPFGQPILIGHHSEGRDRRYRKRMTGHYEKSFQARSRAADLQSRASAAEDNTAISSDDPEAVEKLEEKLAKLESEHQLEKKVNKLIRKGDRAGLAALGLGSESIERLFAPDFAGRIGIPDYRFSNRTGNMRRIRERIALLKVASTQKSSECRVGSIDIEDNVEENRIRLRFPSKPVEAVRKVLVASGMKWSSSERAWQRHRSGCSLEWAKQIAERCSKLMESTEGEASPRDGAKPAPRV